MSDNLSLEEVQGSLNDTIASIEQNLENAYTAVQGKKATMPQYKNLENLASTISNIPLQQKPVTPTESAQTITPDNDYLGLSQVNVEAIPSNYKDTSHADATAGDILQGKVAVNGNGDVTGSIETYAGSTSVNPTTSQQSLSTNGKYMNSDITVNAVTSSIDSNIQPGNIKKNVQILGVSGTLETGGGDEGSGKYIVRVIDYDGSIIKTKNLDAGETFELPTPPTHSKLTFKGWVSPVQIVNNIVTVVDNDILIGPIYDTTSGLNEFDIELNPKTGLTVTFNMLGDVNWGDGSTETISASGVTHTYTNYGNYTITTNGSTLPEYILGGSNSNTELNPSNISLVEVRLKSSNTWNTNYTFRFYQNLKAISIGSEQRYYGGNCLQGCVSLKAIIPSGYKESEYDMVNIPNATTMGLLEYIVWPYQSLYNDLSGHTNWIPNNIKMVSIPSNCMGGTNDSTIFGYGNYNSYVKRIVFPTGWGRISSCSSLRGVEEIIFKGNPSTVQAANFQNCYKLKKLILPGNIQSLTNNCFQYCVSLETVDFSRATQVPTVSAATCFSALNPNVKFIVPDSLYNDWIVASYWSDWAGNIVRVSDV